MASLTLRYGAPTPVSMDSEIHSVRIYDNVYIKREELDVWVRAVATMSTGLETVKRQAKMFRWPKTMLIRLQTLHPSYALDLLNMLSLSKRCNQYMAFLSTNEFMVLSSECPTELAARITDVQDRSAGTSSWALPRGDGRDFHLQIHRALVKLKDVGRNKGRKLVRGNSAGQSAPVTIVVDPPNSNSQSRASRLAAAGEAKAFEISKEVPWYIEHPLQLPVFHGRRKSPVHIVPEQHPPIEQVTPSQDWWMRVSLRSPPDLLSWRSHTLLQTLQDFIAFDQYASEGGILAEFTLLDLTCHATICDLGVLHCSFASPLAHLELTIGSQDRSVLLRTLEGNHEKQEWTFDILVGRAPPQYPAVFKYPYEEVASSRRVIGELRYSPYELVALMERLWDMVRQHRKMRERKGTLLQAVMYAVALPFLGPFLDPE